MGQPRTPNPLHHAGRLRASVQAQIHERGRRLGYTMNMRHWEIPPGSRLSNPEPFSRSGPTRGSIPHSAAACGNPRARRPEPMMVRRYPPAQAAAGRYALIPKAPGAASASTPRSAARGEPTTLAAHLAALLGDMVAAFLRTPPSKLPGATRSDRHHA